MNDIKLADMQNVLKDQKFEMTAPNTLTMTATFETVTQFDLELLRREKANLQAQIAGIDEILNKAL